MHFLKRLKYTSLFRLLQNNYKILVFTSILLLVAYSYQSISLLLILFIYLIYIFKKSKKLFICTFLLISYLMIRIVIDKISYSKIPSSINADLVVEKVKETSNNYQVTFKYKKYKYIAYHDEELIPGDIYHITAKILEPDSSHYPNGFDYRSYLYNQQIYGILEIDSINYVKTTFSLYILNYRVNNYLTNKLELSSVGMIKALTIGNKDQFEEDLLNNISKIGISHLFVISGLHISILISIIEFIVKKIKIKNTHQSLLTIGVLILYFWLCGFLISVFRVIYSYILKYINKTKKLSLSNIDIMAINILTILLINYKLTFSYSFILSYLISSSIIITSHFYQGKGLLNIVKNNFKISLMATLVTIPIVINISPDINLLSVIYNLFYIPFVSYIMLPLAIVITIIPYFQILFQYIYIGFTYITNLLASVKFLPITLPSVNVVIIIIFYVLLYGVLKEYENNGKLHLKSGLLKVGMLVGLIVIWSNIALFNTNQNIYFLDLPKGEATFIQDRFNKTNILIDTGEDGYDDIILFLKKRGIRRIDAIFISHSDSDHCGMLDEICEEFKVKCIYISRYDIGSILKVSRDIKIIKLNKGDIVKINDISFKVISPSKKYQTTNNNSLVLYANIFDIKYLFTGDIEKEVEQNLPMIGSVEVLKVAHHGSNTSTSDEFLSKIKFKYAICMNGYKNQYSFPTQNIVNKLKSKILITSQTKTIIIRKDIFSRKNIIYKI